MSESILSGTAERVSESTDEEVNLRIREETDARVWALAQAGTGAINQRLAELEDEWDIERTLEANAATLAVAGTALGALIDRRFLVLPALVGSFLLQHALQGWCPPVPLFRRMGVRTAREINEERFALKVLRGDFDDVSMGIDAASARQALAAVRE